MFITSEIIRCMIDAARTTVDVSYTRYFQVISFSLIHPIDFFFKIGIHFTQDWIVTKRHKITRKRR